MIMKRITDFRFLLALTLLTSAAFGLSFRASSGADSGKVVATHFVSGVVIEDDEAFYQLTNEMPEDCGNPGSTVCEISSSYTPSGGKIPVSQATAIKWRP